MIVTDDDDLAERCRLIRNHAEAVVDDMPYEGSPVNMVGTNYRLTEMQAALGSALLPRLPDWVETRRKNVAFLEQQLAGIPFIDTPSVRKGCTHSYYVHALEFDAEKAGGVHRDRFVSAVAAELPGTELREAEGPLIGSGYVRPLYWQKLYQERRGIGTAGYPFNDPARARDPDYSMGLCPTVEDLHRNRVFTHEMMRPGMEKGDLGDVAAAFHKVAENLGELRE